MDTDPFTETANAMNKFSRQGDTPSDHPAAGNPYEGAFAALGQMADAEEIPLAIIGGAATAYHGHPRPTTAIDVAVAARDLARLLRECPRYGFEITGWDPSGVCDLSYKQARLRVWQEGVFADDLDAPEALPHPAELGVARGLGFATLAAWVRITLVADREQDRADVVEVIRTKGRAEIHEVETYLAQLPRAFLDRFRQLHELARREQRQQTDDVLGARR